MRKIKLFIIVFFTLLNSSHANTDISFENETKEPKNRLEQMASLTHDPITD